MEGFWKGYGFVAACRGARPSPLLRLAGDGGVQLVPSGSASDTPSRRSCGWSSEGEISWLVHVDSHFSDLGQGPQITNASVVG